MTKLLILTAGLWFAPAYALTSAIDADGSCSLDVILDAFEMQELQSKIEARVALFPFDNTELPAEERKKINAKRLEVLLDVYYGKLRKFRDTFGPVACSASDRGVRLNLDFASAYQALEAYDASKVPAPECDAEFSADYGSVIKVVMGTSDALAEIFRSTLRNQFKLDDIAKDLLRQTLTIGTAEIEKFRAKHPGDFRCRAADGLAESKKLDRLAAQLGNKQILELLNSEIPKP